MKSYLRDISKNARNNIIFILQILAAVVLVSVPLNFVQPPLTVVVNLGATGLPFSQVSSPFLAPYDGSPPGGSAVLTALQQWSVSNSGLPQLYNATGVSPCLGAWLLDSTDPALCQNFINNPQPYQPQSQSQPQPQPPGQPGAAGAFLFSGVSSSVEVLEANSIVYTCISNQTITWSLPGLVNYFNSGLYSVLKGGGSTLNFEYSQWVDPQDDGLSSNPFFASLINATIASSIACFLFISPLLSCCSRICVSLVEDVVTHTKQMQILMGVTEIEYYYTRIIFDGLQYSTILFIPVIFLYALRSRLASAATILLLLLFYFAMQPIIHTARKAFDEAAPAYSSVNSVLLFLFIVPYLLYTVLFSVSISVENGELLAYVFDLYPPFALSQGLRGIVFATTFHYQPLAFLAPENEYNLILPTAFWPCIFLFLETIVYNAVFIVLERQIPFMCCPQMGPKLFQSIVNIFFRCTLVDSCYKESDAKRAKRIQVEESLPEAERIDIEQFDVFDIEDEDVRRERIFAKKIAAEQRRNEYSVIFENLTHTFPPRGLQRYEGTKAVRGFDLAILKGQCFALLGSNGAGKSTVMSILLKQINPSTSGQIFVNGQLLHEMDSATHCSMSYCPQANALFDSLTTLECLEFYCQIRGVGEKQLQEYCTGWLAAAGLTEHIHKRCGNLSGGNKRKLSLAIALIGNPSLVVLDECSAGVDPVARRKLHRLINATKRRGATVILTTHHMDEASILGDRVGIMIKGFLVCLGTPQHLIKRYSAGYLLTVTMVHGFPFETCLLPLLKKDCPEVAVLQNSGPYHCSLALGETFSTQGSVASLLKLLTSLRDVAEEEEGNRRIECFSCGQARLEDVFLGLTERFIKGSVATRHHVENPLNVTREPLRKSDSSILA